MNIKEILVQILELLNSVTEKEWSRAIQKLVHEYEFLDTQSIQKNVLGMYGGMGSFNDLVLYKNGELCPNENSKLDELRRLLFDEVSKIQN